MAGESKIGTDWRDDELDAIVADYFAMLDSDLAGQPYSKSEHNAALMAQIGRTHGSIEYKHQNISAVLDKLGMTWIPGYKPMKNIQHSIFGAIDRYLTGHSSVLLAVPPSPSLATSAASVFVDPPAVTAAEPIPVALRRLVRKFDPVERDHRNRWLGRAGEEFVLNLERRQLAEADRSDFTRKVRWVATEDGDGAGFDVLSFDLSGSERLLEVKTTNGSARTPFFISRNELALAEERPEDWRILSGPPIRQGATYLQHRAAAGQSDPSPSGYLARVLLNVLTRTYGFNENTVPTFGGVACRPAVVPYSSPAGPIRRPPLGYAPLPPVKV
jgi:hypothetical protein